MTLSHPRRVRPVLLVVVLLVTALLAVVGCAVNPATGRRELSLLSPEQEAEIGREGYGAVVAEYGVYDDPALAAYVDSVGRRVARASDLPGLSWRFTVLDDPAVNAFAMPGGYIYVTRGLLAHMGSEAQLAGVLGHEIAHVTARHSARQLTQQTLAGLGLRIATVISPEFEPYSGLAAQGLGLLMLKYSRDDETEADRLGVRYSAVAGYDAREVPGTYRTLQRIAERGGQSLPSWLSTHPDPGDRAERTTRLAAEAMAQRKDARVGERPHLERLRGLVYGEDPRYGWFEGDGTFVHPVLRFRMRFPSGWRTEHTHTAVTAEASGGAGLMQLTLARESAGRSPSEQVVAMSSAGRIASSQGAAERLGELPAWIGRVSVSDGQGGQSPMVAGWVRVSSAAMLQVMGRGQAPGDAAERQVEAGIRSIAPLTDAAALAVRPNRIRVVSASREGSFRTVWQGLGEGLLPLEEGAVLNGLEADDRVPKGRLLKVVDRPRLP